MQEAEFVSDFSDGDLAAEDQLTQQALSLVEELQPLINQQQSFKPVCLYTCHLALLNLDFEYEVRALLYVLWDIDFAQLKHLMKTKPISYWQEQVRSNAFELKNMPASEVTSKVI